LRLSENHALETKSARALIVTQKEISTQIFGTFH